MVEDNKLEQLYSDALEKINKNTNDEKKGSRSRSVELFFSFDIVNSSLYKDTNYLGWQSVLTTLLTDIQKNVTREIPFYNLDMIISLGYRIKSKVATNFRKWATERLKEYMIKGFTMDDERLKGNGGGNYWKELLARIKDIRY